jgi:hypothetical protein
MMSANSKLALVHLEGPSCAPHRNSLPWGTEFSIKRQRIMSHFWENSVPFDTVVCDPSVPHYKELCATHRIKLKNSVG